MAGRCVSARPRVVLLALLLARGRVVSAGRLAELLWGPEPPGSALRSHIHHLRQALHSAGAEQLRLGIAPGGYRLEVDANLLDSERFEQLVNEGRNVLAAGDAHTALVYARVALSLWRGPAMVDIVDDSYAAAEIARLDDLYRTAQHAKFEASPAAGRHVAIIEGLRALLAQRPDDETLRGDRRMCSPRGHRPARGPRDLSGTGWRWPGNTASIHLG